MTTEERLTQMLNERDAEIARLHEKIVDHEEEATDADFRWARHRKLTDDGGLEVPRLELRYVAESPDHYAWRWDYCLVYRHSIGDILAIPLGQTRCTGGPGKPPVRGNIRLPFRDGVHIAKDAEQLRLPAYAICDDRVEVVSLQDGIIAQRIFTKGGDAICAPTQLAPADSGTGALPARSTGEKSASNAGLTFQPEARR